MADMGFGEYVAAALRAQRAVDQVSITDLAAQSGVPFVTLQRYLSGKRAIPLDALDSVAAQLQTGTASAVVAAAEQLRDAAS